MKTRSKVRLESTTDPPLPHRRTSPVEPYLLRSAVSKYRLLARLFGKRERSTARPERKWERRFPRSLRAAQTGGVVHFRRGGQPRSRGASQTLFACRRARNRDSGPRR